MSKLIENVVACIEPSLVELGYELLEVTFKNVYSQDNLTIFIDSDNGISHEDCEKAHRVIDALLDELDPTNGDGFVLNVSSAGIDRPLKRLKDFNKNLNKEIEVSLFKPIECGKKFVAVLKTFNEDLSEITVSIKNIDFILAKDTIAQLKPVIKFN